jgi:hypothetical protein
MFEYDDLKLLAGCEKSGITPLFGYVIYKQKIKKSPCSIVA